MRSLLLLIFSVIAVPANSYSSMYLEAVPARGNFVSFSAGMNDLGSAGHLSACLSHPGKFLKK